MPAVLRTLRTARDTYKNTAAAGRLFGADLFAQLDDADPNSLLNRFEKEASEEDQALAAQAPLTRALSQLGAQLTMFCSHFHQVLDLGITRGTFAAGARSYYGRTVSDTGLPSLSSYDDVQEVADAIVKGEAARQTAEGAGYVAMALPSAAEVAALRDQFKTVRAQAQTAQANTNAQQEDVSALYPEAQALAMEICDTVEFNLRKDSSDSSRRAKAEQWGVVYIYDAAPANGGTTGGGTSGSGSSGGTTPPVTPQP